MSQRDAGAPHGTQQIRSGGEGTMAKPVEILLKEIEGALRSAQGKLRD